MLSTQVITINHLKSCFDKEATPLVRCELPFALSRPTHGR